MVLFNYSTKELTAKVVYYGPGLCGKTTNLQWIHEKLPIKNKGKMLSLATETDRTLFFDFLPIEIGTIRGMKTRIQLYTVPGQVFYNATRRMVLKGADAVVFVCDSQEATFEGNLDSFENLRQNLIANEIDPEEAPVVLQYNKRDLPNALPIEILNERLNKRGYSWHEAVAVKGIGVEETLKTVTKLVFKSLSARYGEAGAQANRSGSRSPVGPAAVPAPPAPPAVSAAPPPPPEAAPPRRRAPQPEPRRVLPPEEPEPAAAQDSGHAFGSLPPIDVELGEEEPAPAPPRRHVQPQKPDLPTRPPVAPTPPPPARELRPERTIVTSRDEADELRRRIATPGLAEDDEALELEELEPEPDEVPRLPLGSAPPLPLGQRMQRTPAPAHQTPPPQPPSIFDGSSPAFGDSSGPAFPEPSFEDGPRARSEGRPGPVFENRAQRTTPAPVPYAAPPTGDELEVEENFDLDAAETEVEVPIDVEIPPGISRLTLRLKLTLSFKRH